MTNVLVTGFEPFGEHETNPSQLVTEALDGVVLPVAYERAADALRAAGRAIEPGGPLARASTLAVDDIVAALLAHA